MSDAKKPGVGTIGWIDLTVEDAKRVRDFYADVVGWRPEQVDMGGYDDYTMTLPETGAPAAGVCHAKGDNAVLPSQWLIYITVKDLDGSIGRCEKGGGKVLVPARTMGAHGRYSVIQDPAGAVAALFELAG